MKHSTVPVLAALLSALAAAVALSAADAPPATQPAAAPAAPSTAPAASLGVTIQRADDTTVAGSLVALEGGQLVLATRTAQGDDQRARVPLADVVEMRFGAAPAPPAVVAAAPPQTGTLANNPQGITAHYFNATFWRGAGPRPDGKATVEGNPDVTKRLQGFEHAWGEDAPDEKIMVDGFSSVLTGRVRTQAAGAYTFVGFSDDEHWVFVNGQMVSADPGAHGARDARTGADPTSVKPIELAAETEYDFVYLHSEGIVDAVHTLRWIPPGANDPVEIPADRLKALTGPPAPPADLRAAAVTEGGVTLAFKDQAANELRFVVERSSDASFKDVQQLAKIAINSDGFADIAVAKGTTYFYRVRAENFEGSASSPVIRVNTPPLPAGPSGPVTRPATTGPATNPAAPVPVAMGPVKAQATAQPAAGPPAPPGGVLPLVPVADPAEAAAGFLSLFDGKTLRGWRGVPDVWSVRDGTITGETVDGRHRGVDTYLVWNGPEFKDFELRFKFKLNGGNSGMTFRATLLDKGGYRVGGYSADLSADGESTGNMTDESGSLGPRIPIAAKGQQVTYTPDGRRRVRPLGPTPGDILSVVKDNDWNEYVITAEGSRITMSINGTMTADVTDEHPKAVASGILALQAKGVPMTIQVKDIRIRPIGPGAPTAAPADQIATTRPADAPWTITLTGGDRLTGSPGEWGEKSLTVRTDAGTLGVPVRYLDEAWRGSPDKVGQARALKAEEGLEDVAFVEAEGGQVRAVRGLTLGVEGDSLKFRYNEQDRQIALERLVGIVFGTADRAGPATELRQSLVLASGDTVSGTWTGFSAGALDLRTDWGATLKVPVEKVDRVRTRNGRLVLLSDFTPDKVEQVPYFDRVIPFRVDKSLTNGPLRLADGEHARGIAVHARTVLQYHTDGKFQRLKTKVGFQQPEGRLGRAVVRVIGDGKPLFERPDFRGDEPPVDLDLDVTGVKRLTLEVDFGEGQDVGDRVVWANPRLLRATQ